MTDRINEPVRRRPRSFGDVADRANTTRSLWIFAAVLCCCAPTVAAPRLAQPASPMKCMDDATRFAGQIGTTVDSETTKANETQLVPKDKVELRFACPVGNQRFPRVQLSWREVYPPAPFWNVVAHSGAALTGASIRRVRLAGHQCHKAALLAANKTAQIRQRGLGVECHVLDGVSSVTLRRRLLFPVNLQAK
jgi:hypothetical protein